MKKIIFLLAIITFFSQSCKKDELKYNKVEPEKVEPEKVEPGTVEPGRIEVGKIEINQVKQFRQIEPVPLHPQLNWYLVLRVDGSADIAPGMDTMEKSTYKISGNVLTVKTNRQVAYEFEILSETDVKLKGANSVILRWKKPN